MGSSHSLISHEAACQALGAPERSSRGTVCAAAPLTGTKRPTAAWLPLCGGTAAAALASSWDGGEEMVYWLAGLGLSKPVAAHVACRFLHACCQRCNRLLFCPRQGKPSPQRSHPFQMRGEELGRHLLPSSCSLQYVRFAREDSGVGPVLIVLNILRVGIFLPFTISLERGILLAQRGLFRF